MPYVVFNPALCSWVGGELFLCCCTFIPVTVYGCNGKMFFGIPRQDRGVDITCLSDILCNDIFRPTGVYRIFIRCINNVHRIITWIIVGSGLPFQFRISTVDSRLLSVRTGLWAEHCPTRASVAVKPGMRRSSRLVHHRCLECSP